jgi:hypothetical protein
MSLQDLPEEDHGGILCDGCGGECEPDDWSDAAGQWLCPACLETILQSEVIQ